MPTTLNFSADVKLPLQYVTTRASIFGLSGSGKTNDGVVIVEELLKANQQAVVIDPTNKWYGLRSARDGSPTGYPIVIFGGSHGDLPLEPTAGQLIADFVVDERVPVILSTRHLETEEQHLFIHDFADRIYRRKGDAEHGHPLHLIWDEAHDIIPSNPIGPRSEERR